MKTLKHLHWRHTLAILLAFCCLNCTRLTAGGPQGYLASGKNGVMFIQFTEQDGRLSGQLQAVGIEGRAVQQQTEARNASFTGIHDGSSLSLRFAGFFTERTVTGTLTGDTLSLVLPQSNGTLATVVFKRGTVGEYNAEVERLKRQVGEINAATQRAQAAEAHTEQVRQQAAEVDSNIQSAYNALNDRIGSLGDALKFQGPLDGFGTHWREMQEHEREFQAKAAVRPLNSYQLDEVGYALQRLGYDQQNIGYDRQNLDYAIKNAQERIADIREAVAALRKAWDDLQAARGTEAGGYIRSEIGEARIGDATRRADAVIDNAENAIKKADSQAKGIERQAAETYKRARARLTELKATPEDE
jgi:hypothetical protein